MAWMHCVLNLTAPLGPPGFLFIYLFFCFMCSCVWRSEVEVGELLSISSPESNILLGSNSSSGENIFGVPSLALGFGGSGPTCPWLVWLSSAGIPGWPWAFCWTPSTPHSLHTFEHKNSPRDQLTVLRGAGNPSSREDHLSVKVPVWVPHF